MNVYYKDSKKILHKVSVETEDYAEALAETIFHIVETNQEYIKPILAVIQGGNNG